MTQDEIRAIAQQVADEMYGTENTEMAMRFATRFLAAINAKAEPFGYLRYQSGIGWHVSGIRLSECDYKRAPIAFYTHPAIEPASSKLQNQVENLAALINRLCRQINKFDSGNAVAVAASKYMHDNGLFGTSLRKDDEGVKKILDMVQGRAK